MANDGKLIKQEKDFTETVDKELPACQELAKVSYNSTCGSFPINAHSVLSIILHVPGWKSQEGSGELAGSGEADKIGQLVVPAYECLYWWINRFNYSIKS